MDSSSKDSRFCSLPVETVSWIVIGKYLVAGRNPMNAIAVFLCAFFLLCAGPIEAAGQESSESRIDHLKAQVEQQQARIEALESALVVVQRLLMGVSANTEKAILIPAVEPSTANLKTAAYEVQSSENTTAQAEQQPLSPKAQKVEDELQRGP